MIDDHAEAAISFGNNESDERDKEEDEPPVSCAKIRRQVILFTFSSIIAAILIFSILFPRDTIYYRDGWERDIPDPEEVPPPSWSPLRVFSRGAVCSDGAPCAEIGKSMFDRNGSAVDAAIAAMICNGIVNMHSMGIGGGFMMTIYEKSTGKSYILNARDRAPLQANSSIYMNITADVSAAGPLSIAVPGEVAGYWEAHQRFGKVKWAELFEPSIKLCETGYEMTKSQHDAILMNLKQLYDDPYLNKLFFVPGYNRARRTGTIIVPKPLCETLKTLAERGANDYYNGTIAEKIVNDIQKMGGIITKEDLTSYRTKWQEPITTEFSNGLKLHTVGLPASGSLLSFILNIFDEFGFTPSDLNGTDSTVLTYHKMVETFKYAYALRTNFGDSDFVDMEHFINNITSKEFAKHIKEKIMLNKTSNNPGTYGANSKFAEDYGTAHTAVLAPNGDAVSVTSTINFYFGSGTSSESTGIVFNNAMDDFGIPSKINYYGVRPSPNNFIQPGKQPVSSMAPSILVEPDGEVKMIIGAAGGTKITTSVSQVIAKTLWMGKTVKEAVDDPRIHHQLFPMELNYEFGLTRPIVSGLGKKGHKMMRYRDRGSIVCAIYRENGTIYANADYRKGGDVFGIDE